MAQFQHLIHDFTAKISVFWIKKSDKEFILTKSKLILSQFMLVRPIQGIIYSLHNQGGRKERWNGE